MATFGSRLRQLREDKGLTQEQLGKVLNVKKAAVSKYENETTSPDHATLCKLADFFDVTTDYLLGRDERRTIYKLPILGTIRAGLPILAQENIEGYLEVPDHIRANFVLRVVGDSMVGVGILDGDYAICRKTEVPQTGQIVVALRDEGTISEATLKFYFNGNGAPKLKAANPLYVDLEYNSGYRCVGVMTALIRENSPGYSTYIDYLTVAGHEEWTEVIEKAAAAGIRPEHLITYIDMMVEMGRRNSGEQ